MYAVSIPYRDDKTKNEKKITWRKTKKFQSLIGTIKPHFCLFTLCNYKRFQSLIGTIKPNNVFTGGFALNVGFQSLIGTIKPPQSQQSAQGVFEGFNPL